MEDIAGKITALAKDASDESRRSIVEALQELQIAIEWPDDTVARIWGGHFRAAVVRVGIDLKFFELQDRAESPSCLSLQSHHTRILQTLAGHRIVKETASDKFAATELSNKIASAGSAAAIKHNFDICGPNLQALPAYLKRNGYKNPNDAHDRAFHATFNTKQLCFEWMMANPEAYEQFNVYMAGRTEKQVIWIDRYPVLDDTDPDTMSPERALLVDVGGGTGHQARNFRAKYPNIPGHVINQDQPFSVDQAKKLPSSGIEHMAHDFFTPQPIKAAKYYYLRSVLHDWPDDKCTMILSHLIDAMTQDSLILIDDKVLPSKGVPWQMMQADISMMAANASMERTTAQWHRSFDAVGLELVRRVVYSPKALETVTALKQK
ncbi:S-adenosyl-L-methionine-dependent methyltransferase [Polyplosphaeria fusca]|uniref:S-adenosyl-L-methionine-dependent methyltransferase n=1 Tax=Polyplosphaeria fusca TaxID=682080 RepID=A0A9P4QP62_9PLEO|nr:S-adenosyl-L-methionine-dependent methyltransferase [Polyplosphaeria fusca]